MKQRMMVSAVALALGVPGVAMADLTVCPTGAAPCYSGWTGLDWSQSNVIADGGNQAVANFGTGASTAFTIFAQGTLGNFGGIAPPPGLNTAAGYTWTYVLGFGEKVTAVLPGIGGFATAFFDFDFTNPLNFWEVYYTPTAAVDVYEGTGFNSGTLVFAGAFTGYTDATNAVVANGSFSIANTNPPGQVPATENLDQTPNGATGDWATSGPGGSPTQTVIGQGTNSDLFIDTLGAAISYVNPAFIKGQVTSYTLQNLSQTLPFKADLPAALGGNVDPSLRFVTSAGAAAPVLFGPGAIGQINGYPIGLGGDGDDIQFQSDFNSVIAGQIPEPGMLGLLGLALAALGARAFRRKS